MKAVLYLPGALPLPLVNSQLTISPSQDQIVLASKVLDCAPTLVDVLANGSGYVIYSVFDSDGQINHIGMNAATKLTSIEFDSSDEDLTLRGPILTVSA